MISMTFLHVVVFHSRTTDYNLSELIFKTYYYFEIWMNKIQIVTIN
jgi:hypothetical protein